MPNRIQQELDIAEEYILTKLFQDVKNPVISKKLQLVMIAKNINFDEFINEKIAVFEEFSKDFMTDDGYYNGNQLSRALALKYPNFSNTELPNMKPIELAKMLDSFIGLDKIGNLIQNL
jgi:hypothetical protein